MATPEIEAASTAAPDHGRPPREDLYRAIPAELEFRAGAGASDAPQLHGHFAVFNQWTEINSMWEGRFLERFVPGSFRKTIADSRDRMRVLFQHGMDPEIGDRPIAAITDLREDDQGAYYEADLLDGVPDLITAGLRAGQYGASFRFSVLREEWDEEPAPSPENPNGLPERTVKEARVMEFGPVTFGAYPTATAGLRSTTDNFLILRSADADARRLLLDRMKTVPMLDTRSDEERAVEPVHPDDCPGCDLATCEIAERSNAPSESDAATTEQGPHLTDERRDSPPPTKRQPIYGQRRKETSKPWLLGRSKSTKRN